MIDANRDAVVAFLGDCRDRQVAFLRELVRVPSDNPPGDLAAHACTWSAGHGAPNFPSPS